MNLTDKHPEFERFLAYFDQPSQDSAFAEHLGHCQECAATLTRLKNFFDYSAASSGEAVGQATTARLLNIYRRENVQPAPTLRERISALLMFDDWKPEFAVNERRSSADNRQLLFRALDFEIEMRLNFSAERCAVSGQFFPECAPARIIIENDFSRFEAATDDFSQFEFEPFTENTYDIIFMIGDREIEIKNFDFIR